MVLQAIQSDEGQLGPVQKHLLAIVHRRRSGGGDAPRLPTSFSVRRGKRDRMRRDIGFVLS